MANFASAIDSLHENEVEEIIIDITQIEESAQWHPECCIYKVPKRLRDVMEQAYTPKLISIGPVHYGKLANMEKLKLKYFKDFFSRPGKSQKEFASIIEEYEDKIRHCYAAEISLPEREVFLKMILLDSIFIIELFLKCTSDQKDYILCKPWLKFGIFQDLILLENQLPFFILSHLYDQSRFPDNHKTFLTLACANFFGDGIEISPENEVKHFTDLQRYFYHPPNQGDKRGSIKHLPSATKLDTAGLLFKKWKPHKLEENSLAANRRLLDIELQKNCLPFLQKLSCLEFLQTRLVIPPFEVDDRTEEHFRNLMALELCHYPFDAYICNYILLLDFLINSKEDVELLVKEGIIVNSLGSNKAVANMVNKLGLEIVQVNSYYFGVADEINKHYLSPWNQNMASLKKVYFRDIWRGSATIAAVLVLIMAILSFLGPSAFRII